MWTKNLARWRSTRICRATCCNPNDAGSRVRVTDSHHGEQGTQQTAETDHPRRAVATGTEAAQSDCACRETASGRCTPEEPFRPAPVATAIVEENCRSIRRQLTSRRNSTRYSGASRRTGRRLLLRWLRLCARRLSLRGTDHYCWRRCWRGLARSRRVLWHWRR
jgi:hypothetical protein